MGRRHHNRNSGQQLAWPMGVPPVKQEPLPLMREIPTPDPFPTDALGPMLANAAVGIQDRTRAPTAICGQSVLAVASLVTQAHANVVLPTGQVRPLSNYFATVGVTGERKSAADYEPGWPIGKRGGKLCEGAIRRREIRLLEQLRGVGPRAKARHRSLQGSSGHDVTSPH